MKTQLKGAICAAALVIVAAGCNDFLKGGDLTKDPNNPLDATPKQYFASVQSQLWTQQTGDLARLTSMWLQQVVGAARQANGTYNFTGVTESSFDGEFARAYQGGGLLDLRKIDAQVTPLGDSIFLGISKIVEAWMIGVDADIWGDIPYNQADSFFVYPQPILDPQQQVYDSVQSKLSQGIAELESGEGSGPEEVDLVYGGDPDKWIALAHTLKARFYLHTAEVIGSPAYANAVTESNLGINDNDGDYIANFSGSQAGESNPWWQFLDANGTTGRNGDIVATDSYLETYMAGIHDPRFSDYFDPGNEDTYDFSPVRENPTYPQPFVTYNENLLIRAEGLLQTSGAGAAAVPLNAERAAWATATPWHSAFTLTPLTATLANIMNEKYIVLFQNIESWNDYKRTCYPQIVPIAGGVNGVIPGRLLYPVGERQTNTNVPAVVDQPARNWNDPAPCPPVD
ncbi:MAG: SusD/RagB family nutrient-binding outer membrane lipoprotein [Gemmatimonadaceae bacterium]|nr:SusD/RagB family nutrient-binding outer membrane lipoprotein [Gemmatimonadaceae bacterium]